MVVAVENSVAASCWKAHVADNSKRVVAGEGVPVEARRAEITAVDSKAAVDAETAAGSKNSQTGSGERNTSKVHLSVLAVHSLLLLLRSARTIVRR